MPEPKVDTACYQITDLPLEQLEDDDPFEFRPFVNTFASLTTNKSNRTPFTVVLDGPWGSGKTTLMQMIRSEVDQIKQNFKSKDADFKETNRPCKTFWFNAWKYAKDDTLMTGLLLEMFRELEKDSNFWDAVKTKIDPKVMLKGVVNKILAPVTKGEFTDGIYEIRLEKHAAFLEEFIAILKKLINHFCSGDFEKEGDQKGVFIIFIDDLDRCPPQRILQVLEAVKLFLDIPGCIFFIGMEVDRVVEAIHTEYVENMKLENFKADRYLQKIIQLHVKIPPVDEKGMSKFLDQLCKEGDGLSGKLEGTVAEVFLKHGYKTKRALKRVLNDFLFLDTLCLHMKKRLDSTGLAKWVVIGSLDRQFAQEISDDFFLLSAWESYNRWKEQKKGNETFEWRNQKIFWEEWKPWMKIKSKKAEESKADAPPEPEWESHTPYFSRWAGFYEKWQGKEWFEPARFLTVGEKSFTTEQDIESYQFINKFIAPIEQEEEEKSPKEFKVVKGHKIGPGADLSGADLRGAKLFEAYLTEANLTGADLRDADLIDADLQGADLSGAKLESAILENATFDLSEIIKAQNWRSAKFSPRVLGKLKKLDKNQQEAFS